MFFYSDYNSHKDFLIKTLDTLYRKGIKGNNITILSPRSDDACLSSTVDQEPWKSRLSPIEYAAPTQIPYCSIFAYKGLESHAVIVTDLDTVKGSLAESLLYIGISRALSSLTLLANKQSKTDFVSLVVNPLKETTPNG
jgi:hypothetical protein